MPWASCTEKWWHFRLSSPSICPDRSCVTKMWLSPQDHGNAIDTKCPVPWKELSLVSFCRQVEAQIPGRSQFCSCLPCCRAPAFLLLFLSLCFLLGAVSIWGFPRAGWASLEFLVPEGHPLLCLSLTSLLPSRQCALAGQTTQHIFCCSGLPSDASARFRHHLRGSAMWLLQSFHQN